MDSKQRKQDAEVGRAITALFSRPGGWSIDKFTDGVVTISAIKPDGDLIELGHGKTLTAALVAAGLMEQEVNRA